MFTYVFKALDDTVNFTVGTRRLIVSLLPQMIPEDKALAWLAAAETINVNSEDCMSKKCKCKKMKATSAGVLRNIARVAAIEVSK